LVQRADFYQVVVPAKTGILISARLVSVGRKSLVGFMMFFCLSQCSPLLQFIFDLPAIIIAMIALLERAGFARVQLLGEGGQAMAFKARAYDGSTVALKVFEEACINTCR
jgi:hypothetical protein